MTSLVSGSRFPLDRRTGVAAVTVALASVLLIPACGPSLAGRAAVSLSLKRAAATPADASVTIDEQYIGPLGYVAAHGVRLPVGEHRISVEKDGYFPWDKLVDADRKPIHLDIVLQPIPD